MKDYFEFIEKCCPKFTRGENGELKMFSCPTQWISGNNAKELLDVGVKAFKEVGANISYFEKWKRDLIKEIEDKPIPDEVFNLTQEDLDKISEYMRDRYIELLGIR
jgi:hypothetical protein